MTEPDLEWRAGPLRVVGVLAMHLLAAFAVVQFARHWPFAWTLLALVLASVCYDAAGAWRERGRSHRLRCTPFGVTLDGVDWTVRDAWLAIGWTVLTLREPRGWTRLLYVHRSELTPSQFAALRRHVKSLAYA
jgi:hypothetical protein